MDVVSVSPQQLLDQAQTWLERREVENNVMLGVAAARANEGPRDGRFWLVRDDAGKLQLAAMLTPPFKLFVTNGPEAALLGLLAHVVEHDINVPGVVGPQTSALFFATSYAAHHGLTFNNQLHLRYFQLDAVTQLPDSAPGRMVQLTEANSKDFIVRWFQSFIDDSGADGLGPDAAWAYLRSGRLFGWRSPDHGAEVVAMAGFTGQTRRGARVNAVYTPDAHRKKGYATSLVAALSQHLLDSGLTFCCLNADVKNPTSNAIYQRIGYRPLGEMRLFVFE